MEYDLTILRMRQDGRTWQEIGTACGRDVSTVYRRYMAMLTEERTERGMGRDMLRDQEISRLDIAVAAIADRVRAGDLDAIDRWIKAMQVRARLVGLNSPEESSSVVTIHATPVERVEGLRTMLRAGAEGSRRRRGSVQEALPAGPSTDVLPALP